MSPADQELLRPYVPRLVVDWLRDRPADTWQEVEGSLAFVDISGFTKLTEKLARRGRVGAEEMSDTLSATFSSLLSVAYEDGAGLVKWGGDAVLLLFDGPDHAPRAARAAFRMRQEMRRVGRVATSSGAVTLRMSVGIHSGVFHFFLVGDPAVHRELLVSGPAASVTARVEGTASAGEIGLSGATAALLGPAWATPADPIWLLAGEPTVPPRPAPPAPPTAGLDIGATLPPPIRAHLLAGGGEPEHRRIAVAFVQFSGTDDLLASDGPAVLADALDECVRNVQDATSRFGVTFFETDINADGGKIMLVAGAPASGGRNEERMLLATRLLLDRPGRLPVRVGVNGGPVFSGDFGPTFRRTYSVKGDAINLAARVMGKAVPGQLLATAATLARSETAFVTEPLPPFLVKGKSQPVEAASVGPVRAGSGDGNEPPLVGRSTEMAALRASLVAAREGQGRVVELVGEPGIGKSRLCRALVAEADDVVTLSAVCTEYQESTPYYPWRSLLRQVVGLPLDTPPQVVADRLRDRVAPNHPELVAWLPLLGLPLDVDLPATAATAGLDERFRKARMEEVVEQFLEATLPTATLLVLEDVEHMDEASEDLLARVTAGVTHRPWLVLLTRAVPAGSAIDQGLRGVEAERLVPSPLGPAAAAALAAAVTAAAPLPPYRIEAIVARAGGNPLFLQGLLSTSGASDGDGDLPESVEGLVTARIDRLPTGERGLLRCAAVLGATFAEADLRELLTVEELPHGAQSLGRLAEFLEPAGHGRFRFRHALMRDTAYLGLPFRRRQSLHAQVGTMLERSGAGGDEQTELLSLHFFHAADYRRAWRYSLSAGDRAAAKVAYVQVSEFLHRAVDCARRLGDIPDADLAEVYRRLGDAERRLGGNAAAARAYASARQHLRHDDVAAGEVLLRQALLREREGRVPAALTLLSRGLRLLADRQDVPAVAQRSRLAWTYAWCRLRQSRYQEAWRWAKRAEADAERSDDPAAQANAYQVLEAIAAVSSVTLDRPYGEMALKLYTDLGDTFQVAATSNTLAVAAYVAGRWSQAVDLYQQARDRYEEAGDIAGAAFTAYNLAELTLGLGRVAEAEAELDHLLPLAAGIGEAELVAAVTRELGRARVLTGRTAEGRALLVDARGQCAALGSLAEVLATDAALVECDLREGDAVAALARCDTALGQSRGADAAASVPRLRRLRGAALAAAGRSDEARSELEGALDDPSVTGSSELAFLLATLADVLQRIDAPEAVDFRARADAALAALGAQPAAVVLGPG